MSCLIPAKDQKTFIQDFQVPLTRKLIDSTRKTTDIYSNLAIRIGDTFYIDEAIIKKNVRRYNSPKRKIHMKKVSNQADIEYIAKMKAEWKKSANSNINIYQLPKNLEYPDDIRSLKILACPYEEMKEFANQWHPEVEGKYPKKELFQFDMNKLQENQAKNAYELLLLDEIRKGFRNIYNYFERFEELKHLKMQMLIEKIAKVEALTLPKTGQISFILDNSVVLRAQALEIVREHVADLKKSCPNIIHISKGPERDWTLASLKEVGLRK